ncbi:MAG: alpha/beta fold hydrolase [Streptosporangiales bacterium]|nr:alpha/beta fold hydrolase [Streptosporangiales bacterium]
MTRERRERVRKPTSRPAGERGNGVRLRKRARIALGVSAGVVAVLALVVGGYVIRNVTYASWDASRVKRAGFTEHQVRVNGSLLNYAEGPDNGPPLLLIHGQLTDWRSWSRALPELSQQYHVYAIDCYGHGRSAHVPDKYSANALAADVQQFLTEVVGEPATVAGHSSGGLIAAALAADAPEQVRGVVLEDPPFFSSVLPRAKKTFNYVDLATTTHEFLRSGEKDFTTFYIRNAAVWDLFQGAKDRIQGSALSYRKKHPDEPLRLFYMPPVINDLFRGMESYDPRFGETFYDDSFNQDFDHARTLERITVTAVLIHTNWSYDDNGVLLAAMSGEDAQRARSLLKDVEFFKVDSGHGFHFEKPREFTQIALDFEKRERSDPVGRA